MPVVEFEVIDRIARHLAAVRLMSCMVFPNETDLRTGAELVFRTQLAEFYADAFAKLGKREQRKAVKGIAAKLGGDTAAILADPAQWARGRIFDSFLRPLVGGTLNAAVTLAETPSAGHLRYEWTRRSTPIEMTGRLLCLIGSIHEHHPRQEASLNKAIYILCQTEGSQSRERRRAPGFPGIYESSLKKAWAQFKSVAHLCAAYVAVESHFYKEIRSRDIGEYWEQPPAFYDDRAFVQYCRLAKWAERFATSFFPRGQRRPLIEKEEIFSLPDGLFEPDVPVSFRELTDEESAALNRYQAPKQLV